jgi:hypothetical protein
MNGVAKLFTHYEGYRRAEQIAGGSRHWGLPSAWEHGLRAARRWERTYSR